MLQQLSVKNYATVDTLEIELESGMSVITGETGAGKSIILGALGLTLGDRADKTVVRSGAKQADISACFDTREIDEATDWLRANDFDADVFGACILRRVVGNDGRSRGYINGAPVTMANLRTLGEMLIDIHSQHEHQSLLKRATQQRLLDEFCVERDLSAQLDSTWKQWQQNFQQWRELSERSGEDSAQAQLLAYQLNELAELAIGDTEVQDLEAEFKTLHHADATISAVQQALALCSEDESRNAVDLLHQTLTTLRGLPETDPGLRGIITLLENAEVQLSEAALDLRTFSENFEANPQRLEQINARLSTLHDLARKHRVSAAELPAVTASLQAELDRFRSSDDELKRLQENDQSLRERWAELAGAVSSQRSTGAARLGKQVNERLWQLGMPHARLEVRLNPAKADNPSAGGLETVEFLVSTNPEQPALPLLKIASGGELSRISLAIQVVTAQTSRIPSLVFDEVDVGIGGGVARVVGELLRELGARTQILCVTHQAQVASRGQHHLVVSKHTGTAPALTRIKALDGDEVVREVARMLAGEEFSEESLAHAEQMVAGSVNSS